MLQNCGIDTNGLLYRLLTRLPTCYGAQYARHLVSPLNLNKRVLSGLIYCSYWFEGLPPYIRSIEIRYPGYIGRTECISANNNHVSLYISPFFFLLGFTGRFVPGWRMTDASGGLLKMDYFLIKNKIRHKIIDKRWHLTVTLAIHVLALPTWTLIASNKCKDNYFYTVQGCYYSIKWLLVLLVYELCCPQ